MLSLTNLQSFKTTAGLQTHPGSDHVVATGNGWRRSGRRSSAGIGRGSAVRPEDTNIRSVNASQTTPEPQVAHVSCEDILEGFLKKGAGLNKLKRVPAIMRVVVVCLHSLVPLRPFPAAQPEPPQQLVPAQEHERSQSEQRENEEEEDEQAVPERRVLICGGRRVSAGQPSGPRA